MPLLCIGLVCRPPLIASGPIHRDAHNTGPPDPRRTDPLRRVRPNSGRPIPLVHCKPCQKKEIIFLWNLKNKVPGQCTSFASPLFALGSK